MCRFGVPLAAVAEPLDGPWADGVRRIAADARASPSSRGCSCPPTDGPRHQHADRGRPGRRRALRQDPPLRRVRVHRVPHRRPRPRAGRDHRRRRGRRADASATTSASPSSTSSWRGAAHSSSPCTRRGAPDRASSTSGRCWPAPGRWTPRASSPRSVRPTRATRSPRWGRPGVGGSVVASPLGEVVAAAGADPHAARHRYRHRTPWSRSGTRSRCCVTAQASPKFIGQNRGRD